MAKTPRPAAATARVDLLHVSVSFAPDVAAALAEEAARAGITRAALVRRVVAEWLGERRGSSAAPGAPGTPEGSP